MREARHRVADMLKAIDSIESHVGLDEAHFRNDQVLQGFVAYQLMILGEAAYKMLPDVRQRYPDVPWRSVSGMRHVLVHGYFSVDLGIVWGVVQRDLPVIKAQLQRILADLE